MSFNKEGRPLSWGNNQIVAVVGVTGAKSFAIESGDRLPPGLSLNVKTGAITGRPTSVGDFTFDIIVTDSIGATATESFTVDAVG